MLWEELCHALRFGISAGEIPAQDERIGADVVAGQLGIACCQRGGGVCDRAVRIDGIDVPIPANLGVIGIGVEADQPVSDASYALRITDGDVEAGDVVQGVDIVRVEAQRGQVLAHRLAEPLRKLDESPAQCQVSGR